VIYICFGIPKTASTFLYQLTEQTFRAGGRRTKWLRPPFRPFDSVDNYFGAIDGALLARLSESLESGVDLVLKTHGPLHPEVSRLIESGSVLASASVRDPREIALSMLDHGQRTRRWRFPNFSQYRTLADTLPTIDAQIENFQRWAAAGARVFNYNQICFGAAETVKEIAAQIGVAVDPETVLAKFRKRCQIGQFNKGVAYRFREMTPADSTMFLARYATFYSSLRFETAAADRAAAASDPCASRACGEMREILTKVRRYFTALRDQRAVLRA